MKPFDLIPAVRIKVTRLVCIQSTYSVWTPAVHRSRLDFYSLRRIFKIRSDWVGEEEATAAKCFESRFSSDCVLWAGTR